MTNPHTILKRSFTVYGLIFFLFFNHCLYAANDWKLEKNEEGIKVYLRNTPGSPVKSFMGKIKIKASISSIASVLDDTNNYPRWLFKCKSAKMIDQQGDSLTTRYIVTDMPWPVADRDSIIISKRTQNPNTKKVKIQMSTNPKQVPLVKGKVRIQNLKGQWLINPINENELEVIYEMSIDPGGNIPKWIVNAMTFDLPFHALRNLKKISKEPKYVNAKVPGIIN